MADIGTYALDAFEDEAVQDILEQNEWMRACTFKLLTKRQEVTEYIDAAIEKGLCALDLETTSLNTRKELRSLPTAKIVGVCLATDVHEGIYIPVKHDDMEYNLPYDFMVRELKRLVMNCVCVYHNFKYDGAILYNHGIFNPDESAYEDTLIMASIDDASRKTKGLKYLSESVLKRPMVEIDGLGITGNTKKVVAFNMVHPQKAVYYGGSDAMNTLALYHFFKKNIDKQDPTGKTGPWAIYKVEKRCLFVTLEMERNLILLDIPYLRDIQEKVLEKCQGLLLGIFEIVGRKFDVNSPKQLGTVLFDELKVPYPSKERTASGQYQTSQAVLEKIQSDHPVVKMLLSYRHMQKVVGTYVNNLIMNADENSCVRFQMNQNRADTGRFTATGGSGLYEDGYSGVNCQNIPAYKKKDPDSIDLRRALIARPGKKIVTIDYSGEELRIATNLSKEPNWLEEFINGSGDLHTITARAIYQKDAVDKDERSVGKCVAKGTLIASGRGWVPIEELSPKDRVITHTGALKKIDSVHDMGVKAGCIIETSSGHKITCGVNHRFLTTDDEWVRAEELEEGQEIKTVSCEKMNPKNNDRILFNFWDKGNNNYVSENLPYIESNYLWGKLLGYLMGGGHIHPYYAGVVCSDDYGDVKEDIMETAKNLGLPCSAKLIKRPDKPLWNINIGSTIFSRFCKRIGFQGRKGKVFRVPSWVFKSTKEVMRGFLQGLFETDGTIDKSTVSMCTKDKELAQDIVLLLASFGIKAYIYDKPSKRYNRFYYQVQFGRQGADVFYKEINFISQLKKDRLKAFVSRPRHPGSPNSAVWSTKVKSVVHIGDIPLWDLTVEDDHTYVAQGIVTHNTLNFLTVYGGGAGGFSQVAKIPYETAKRMQINFFKENKVLQKWIKDEALRAKKRGYSRTALGRRRPLQEFYSSPDKGIQAKGDRCAINSCIQGAGADVIKIALYRVWKWIHEDPEREKHIRILMPVHDEIVYEITETKMEDYIPELSRVMKLDDIVDKLGWSVKFEVDAEYGDSFSVTHDFKNYYKNGEFERIQKLKNIEEGIETVEDMSDTAVENKIEVEDKKEVEVNEENEVVENIEEGVEIVQNHPVASNPTKSPESPKNLNLTITIKDEADNKSKPISIDFSNIDEGTGEDTTDVVALKNPVLKDKVDARGYFNYTLENTLSQMTSLKIGVIFKMLLLYDESVFMGPLCRIKIVSRDGDILYKTKKKFSVDAFVSLCMWNEI